MRVLIDVSAVPSAPVGAGRYTVELVRALADGGTIDLSLLARRDDGSRWDAIAPEAGVHAVAPSRRPGRLVWEQAAAPRLADELGIEVWHGPHYTLPLRSSVPRVVTVHDLTLFDHPEWHERTKVAYFGRMAPAAVRRASGIVVVSAHTAAGVRDRFDPSAPVWIAPHGVDHTRFRTEPADDDMEQLRALGVRPPYVAFVGLLEPRKDVPALVEAFARVAPTRPNLRLVLAGGDGWGARAVRNAVAASGIASHVVRPGYVADTAVPALLRHAEVVAYPSLVEGFGLPALEALACGAPLISTHGSAIEEVAGDAAVLVPPGDARALGEALEWLIDDPVARADLALRGPARARPYTWAASAAVHLDAYGAAAPASRAVHAMKAAVTGARGFVGPHLVALLESLGDEVVSLDRRGPDPFDVTDPDAVRNALQHAQPDAVYHLAALSHVGDSWKAPALAFRVNAEGTLNVLRACIDLKIDRVLVVGSAEEYGRVEEADLPLHETAPLRPITPYGASKVAADYLALQAYIGDELGVIRARPFSHTGPGQEPRFVTPALASRIARAEREGRHEITVGSLDAVRDLTDVRDVVRAYRLLVERGEPGEVYNVCSGHGVSVAEIAEGLLGRARHRIRTVVDPHLVRSVEVPRLVGDNTRLRAATGWAPEYGLDITLADVLDSARAAL